jgi:murein DD-endopeptidase MepM/ murein hydrolase activator NlpD
MPVPAGTVVLCQQGNFSPPGRTHFKENNRHALDLSNTAAPSLTAVSAAPGRVAYVFAGSDPDDKHAGLGYGNQLKIEHGNGYFTMYAHLDQVFVHEGDVLENAAPIGTVGFTGAAGNRHLHFSLHQGDPVGMGVYETTAMDALVTTDVSERSGFRAMSSTDLLGGQLVPWDGALYGSENSPATKPLTGAPPPDLATLLDAGRRVLAQAVTDRKTLETVSREWASRDVAWARAQIAPILERAPRHALARYWRATAMDAAERRWAEAEVAYLDLLRDGRAEATWETWLVSWCHNRLGVIARERGLMREARAHFEEGESSAIAEPERAFAREALVRLDGVDAGR